MKKSNTKKQTKPISKQLKRQRILASVLLFFVASALLVSVFTGIYAMSQINAANQKDLGYETFATSESTKLMAKDKDGEWFQFYDTGMTVRDNITFDEMPDVLIDAFIATEDSRFFIHDGWDVPRFVSAMVSNVVDTLRYQTLVFGQGGSTFDMQLVKNKLFMFDAETGEEIHAAGGLKGIGRKFQEIYIAKKINHDGILTKKEIFENYVNTINYGVGHNIRGVQNSAEIYFDKDVSELNLVESAFLAGVINAPNYYSPFKSIERAQERTHTVLHLMKLHGYIDQKEYDVAMSVPLENLFKYDQTLAASTRKYQAFADMVLDEAQNITKVDPVVEPMVIYTTMNIAIQEEIDLIQDRKVSDMDPQTITPDTQMQMGATILNNETGAIIGVFGGYDYGKDGQRLLVRGTRSLNAPGSTIKPMVTYAPLFDKLGYATSHVLTDAPLKHAGTDFDINNWDRVYKGDLTIMEAIADSRNTTAVESFSKQLSAFGRSATYQYLTDLGFKSLDESLIADQYGIGGGEGFEVTPAELAASTAVALNGGHSVTPHGIERIEFKGAQAKKEPYIANFETKQVLSEGGAYLASRALWHATNDVYPGNSSMRRVRRSYPVFGKTGTNIWDRVGAAAQGVEEGAVRDRIMIAARHDYSIGVWTGFDVKKAEFKPWFSNAENNFNITAKFSSAMLDILAAEYGVGQEIPQPSDVVSFEHIQGTFPYQAPLPDMNQNLIVKGMIKREFLDLVQATPQDLLPLKSQDVSVSQKDNEFKISVKLPVYPEADKLIEAKADDKDLGGGKVGRRLYDDSWLYGPVRYKTAVIVNGQKVDEFVSEKEKYDFTYKASGTVQSMEICSYYGFAHSEKASAAPACYKVDIKAVSNNVTVPRFTNGGFDQAYTWLDSHVNQVDVVWNAGNNLKNFGLVSSVKSSPISNIEGKSMTEDDLDDQDVTLTVHDFELLLNQAYNSNDLQTAAKRGQFTLTVTGDPSGTLQSVNVNGNAVTNLRMSTFRRQNVELIFN